MLGPPNPSRRPRRRRRDLLPGPPRHGQERRRGPQLDHLPLLPLLLLRRRRRRRVLRRLRRRGDLAMRGAVGEGGRGSVR